MSARSSANEIQLPSLLDDFEPRDRICFQGSNNLVRFGSVLDVYDDFMWITVSGFSKKAVRVRNTGNEKDNLFHVSQWRKIPDETLIQKGDILSTTCSRYVSAPEQREYFTVVDIVPGKIIVLIKNDVSGQEVSGHSEVSLDSYLKDWELEG